MTSRAISVCLLFVLSGAIPSRAQRVPRELAVTGDTLTVVADSVYRAGWFKKLIFGSDYRELWAIPVSVPVLDLAAYAGGLTPLKPGGDGQTTSLHFTNADGVRYVFRSIDKNPERALPSDLQGTLVASVIHDQTSSQHPYASLVVPDLLDVTGILHEEPTLYVMPDDPRLGEYREKYAGLFGGIEERPDEAPDGGPGFAGSDKVVSSTSLYEDLPKHGQDRVDGVAFLQARLMDVFIGDRDRHFDQWRWARFDNPDGSRLWYPIPKDRDQAFKVNDGLMMAMIRSRQRQYVSFGEKYADIEGTTAYGRELDRRLLVGLESAVWDSVAADLQARLTDEVIESAVGHLPPEVYEVTGDRLIRELKMRRDNFTVMARKYYSLLAKVVDLHTSDDGDVATIDRRPDGTIHVAIRTQSGYPYFERTFYPDETDEIRVLTHGGDDSLTVSGRSAGGIKLRVLPGGGDDVMIDTSVKGGGKTLWYDHRGDNVVQLGDNAKLDTSVPYEDHPDEKFEPPHHDEVQAWKSQTYGRYWYSIASAGFAPDFGGILTAGAYEMNYGFRKEPFRYKWQIQGTITTSGRGKLMTRFDVPDFGPAWESHAYAHWSQIETIRFNGFGNEVAVDSLAGSDFYKTKSTEVTGSYFFTKHLYDHGQIDFGPLFTYARDETAPDRYVSLNADSLLGADDNLALIGVGVSLTHDTRDNPGAANKGIFVNVQGRWIPKVLGTADLPDNIGGFYRGFGTASAYVTGKNLPLTPTVAGRIGGAFSAGDYPYYRAALLGGTHTIRGYRQARYAGNAMAFANAELRLKAVSFLLILPWDAGVHGFYDAGRVWYDGDPADANSIHTAYGAGLWFSILHRAQTFRISYAFGEEDSLFYFGAGFYF